MHFIPITLTKIKIFGSKCGQGNNDFPPQLMGTQMCLTPLENHLHI